MVDFASVRAIDFHTHAEEPCGCHADDGYDDLQAAMAKYFGAPWAHPPTMQETAAHYRAQNIAAVIFPVDAERETGYRRYRNEEVAALAAAIESADVQLDPSTRTIVRPKLRICRPWISGPAPHPPRSVHLALQAQRGEDLARDLLDGLVRQRAVLQRLQPARRQGPQVRAPALPTHNG